MGMVFQHFNLFPHLSVIENITLAPIKVKKKNASDANKKAIELLNIVGLSDKADSYPGSAVRRTETENSHSKSSCNGTGYNAF